jgi:protein TorT
MEEGFRDATADSPNVELLTVKYGDTDKNVQLDLLQNTLQAFPETDYIVGNAVAGEAAVNLLESMGMDNVKIVTTYATPPVVEQIYEGNIAMAPTDYTAIMARMSVDAAVQILQGEEEVPWEMGPVIGIVSTDNIDEFVWESTFAPKDWEPEFEVNW